MPRAKAQLRDRFLQFHANGSTYFRITLPGPHGPVPIRKSLGDIDRDTARRVRDALVHTLNGARAAAAVGIELPHNPLADYYGVDAMLRKLDIIRAAHTTATIGELIAAFHLDAPGRRDEIGERHEKMVPWSLRKILRETHPSKNPDTLNTTILTEDLLEDFKSRRIEAAQYLGPLKLASARRSVASMTAQARSIVSPEARRQTHMRRLALPDLTGFRTWRPGASTRRVHQELDDTTHARLTHTVHDLWFNDAPAWLALTLSGNLGLRRGESTIARWSWVRFIRQIPTLFLVKTDTSQPKGNERKLAIPADLWADMLHHRTGSDYIIPGDTLKDRDRVFKRTAKLLRGLGIEVQKPNHELRAVQLQAVRNLHGMEAAQKVGGHSDARTTQIYTGPGTGQPIRTL